MFHFWGCFFEIPYLWDSFLLSSANSPLIEFLSWLMQTVLIPFQRPVKTQQRDFTANPTPFCQPFGRCRARLSQRLGSAWLGSTAPRRRSGRLCGRGGCGGRAQIKARGGGGKVPCSTCSKEQSLFLSGPHSTARAPLLDFYVDLRTNAANGQLASSRSFSGLRVLKSKRRQSLLLRPLKSFNSTRSGKGFAAFMVCILFFF